MTSASWHKIIWVYTVEFRGREVPLVLLSDGRPGYIINQWIFSLLEEEITQSKLEQYVRALCHLYEFNMARYGHKPLNEHDAKGLVAEFIDAKRFGTDIYCVKDQKDERHVYLFSLGLTWMPTSIKNIKNYLDAINEFNKWQTTYHGATNLNPEEVAFKNSLEIYNDFKIREKWDPLIHLHGTRLHVKHDYENQAGPIHEHSRFKQQRNKKGQPKAFPRDRIINFIDNAKNPRDKMLLILMAGGSLRESEPLHLFHSDVEGMNELGEAKVRLEDPTSGNVDWEENGVIRHGTRQEYFDRVWCNDQLPLSHPLRNLQPRCSYGKRNQGLHAGWKGMTFSESDGSGILGSVDGRRYDIQYVWWIDPHFGAYFYKCYEEYMNQFIWNNPFTGKSNPRAWPYHPWLFIRLDKLGYGMPLTIPAVKKIWSRLLISIDQTDCELGLHSLRHLYGHYSANVLQLPIETTQVLMHHASITSTQVYYCLEKSVVRQQIVKAALLSTGLKADPKFMVAPETPKLRFPEHWSNLVFDRAVRPLLIKRR